jgi:nicotinate-nucleotide pyrophosphorylase (carboxylating)
MTFDRMIKMIVEQALSEDIGIGDVTTEALIAADATSSAVILAKQDLVLAGLDVCRAVFQHLNPEIEFTPFAIDRIHVRAGTEIAQLFGITRDLLTGERVALNLLQQMSGIATMTARYVDRIRGLKVALLDTRKTHPGMRQLEKYAVMMGGGRNHRFGLYDGVLIKDNHITAAGSVTKAVGLARQKANHLLKIEIETRTLDEVREALAAKADIIMLDNMHLDMMREAVKLVNHKAVVEASGNVTLETIRAIAETGVDFISCGSLTHSAPAADISMKIKE